MRKRLFCGPGWFRNTTSDLLTSAPSADPGASTPESLRPSRVRWVRRGNRDAVIDVRILVARDLGSKGLVGRQGESLQVRVVLSEGGQLWRCALGSSAANADIERFEGGAMRVCQAERRQSGSDDTSQGDL